MHFTVLKLSWNKHRVGKTYKFTMSNVTLAAEIFLPLLFSISTWMGIPSPGTKPIVSNISVAEIGPDLQQRQHRVISLLASAGCCKITTFLCEICVTFLLKYRSAFILSFLDTLKFYLMDRWRIILKYDSTKRRSISAVSYFIWFFLYFFSEMGKTLLRTHRVF